MKKYLSVFLLIALGLSLVACTSVSKQELVGAWSGSWSFHGSEYMQTFTLDAEGTYISVVLKNGDIYESEAGSYEIDGSELRLHPDGDMNRSTPYEFDDGKLYNNDHEFIKD